ncbi:MAG: hypothetical protein K0S75_2469 [Clostridia bacterium]|jgi:hypothetical protein|nr:hypothetical protein [Clostridia bacterium]
MEKYRQYYFWESILKNNEEVWKNSFRNLPLNYNSKFINTVIVDCNNGVMEDNWVYYPNVEALLGFIHHVFLPTAFALILFPEPGEFITPMATAKELLDSAEEMAEEKNRDTIAIMRDHDAELHSIWDMDEEEMWRSLHHFSQRFNEIWGKSNDVFFYFTIFNTPMEIGEYLIEEYDKDDMLDYFEDESGMSKEEWMDTCNGVYENDFLRLKFIDILNNRAKVYE